MVVILFAAHTDFGLYHPLYKGKEAKPADRDMKIPGNLLGRVDMPRVRRYYSITQRNPPIRVVGRPAYSGLNHDILKNA